MYLCSVVAFCIIGTLFSEFCLRKVVIHVKHVCVSQFPLYLYNSVHTTFHIFLLHN